MRVDWYNGRPMGMVKVIISKFKRSKEMNLGITLVISFWLLSLVLGVNTMREGGVSKDK